MSNLPHRGEAPQDSIEIANLVDTRQPQGSRVALEEIRIASEQTRDDLGVMSLDGERSPRGRSRRPRWGAYDWHSCLFFFVGFLLQSFLFSCVDGVIKIQLPVILQM